MSSWKKAAKTNQKTHRERHQPAERHSLGLLEKKKDYRQRANDHNEKKAALQLLQKRALNKNPDEFYFHMARSRIVQGEHMELGKKDEHTEEQLQLMQTQDMRYISMKLTSERNKIKKLQAELHLLDAAEEVPNTHTFYVDEPKEALNFDVAERLDTHPALLGRRSNRMRLSTLKTVKLPDLCDKDIAALNRKKQGKYAELEKRLEREKQLSVALQKLQIKQRLLKKKEEIKKRVKRGTKDAPPVYLWKAERKR